MSKITFNKVSGDQFTAENIDEIKSVVNENDDTLIAITERTANLNSSGEFSDPTKLKRGDSNVGADLTAIESNIIAPILTQLAGAATVAELPNTDNNYGDGRKVAADGFIYTWNGYTWKSTKIKYSPTEKIDAIETFIHGEATKVILLEDCDVNIFNKDEVVLDTKMTDRDVILVDSNYFTSNLISVRRYVGKTLFFSTGFKIPNSDYYINRFDKKGVLINNSWGAGATQLTVDEDTYYIRIQSWKAYLNTFCISVDRIENYEPFKKRVSKTDTYFTPEIVLPHFGVYVTEGKRVNLFFENLLYRSELKKESIYNSSYDVFENHDRFIRSREDNPTGLRQIKIILSKEFYPTPDAGFIKNTDIVKSAVLCIAPSINGIGLTKKVVIQGDSFTEAGVITQQVYDRGQADAMKIQLIGTMGGGVNLHEGRGGWSAKDYCTLSTKNGVANPFWNPNSLTFDYGYYIANNSFASPDWHFINLGTNDAYNCTDTEIIEYYRLMVARIKAASPATKIGVGLLSPPCLLTNNQPKKNRFLEVKKLLVELYDNWTDEGRGGSIYLCDYGVTVDNIYDFNLVDSPISDNNPLTHKVPTDEIHLNDFGYKNIGDVIFSMIKYYA